MKKILLIITLSQLLLLGQQTEITNIVNVSENINFSNSQNRALDTIFTYFNRATGYYTLSDASGYVLGTHTITTETGCHYDDMGVLKVTDLFVYFNYKSVVGATDSVTAHVYAIGIDSVPTTLLGSGKASTNSLDVSGFPTIIPISNYTPQSGQFIVSIEYGNINDTISIFSSNPTNTSGGPDGNNEYRVRQKTTLGWLGAADIWTVSGNAYNADALICPVVDISSSGISDMGDFILESSFPNPATEMLFIPIKSTCSDEICVTLIDTKGQTIQKYTLAGYYDSNLEINTSNLVPGTYFYIIQSKQNKIASKFIIQ